MAQQFHIDNGGNIDAGWVAHIAISHDGTNWTTLPKAGLSVRPVIKKANTASPLAKKENTCRIELWYHNDDTPAAYFDVDNVANQAGWTGGATIVDRCVAAVTDITTWLGECCAGSSTAGLASESTLQMVLNAINDGQDFESHLVIDDNGDGDVYLEVRIWNSDTQTWEAPLYYAAGSNVGVPAGSLTAPIIYMNPLAVLNIIASNTGTLATPVTGLAVGLSRITGAGAANVPAGHRRVSFLNAGNTNASVAGATLARGEFVSFNAGDLRDVLDAIPYDALTSTLLISTVG